MRATSLCVIAVVMMAGCDQPSAPPPKETTPPPTEIEPPATDTGPPPEKIPPPPPPPVMAHGHEPVLGHGPRARPPTAAEGFDRSTLPPAAAGESRLDPKYTWLPPVTPITYGRTGLFSIAVSYDKLPPELQAILVSKRPKDQVPDPLPDLKQESTHGAVSGGGDADVAFLRAQIDCSQYLKCSGGDATFSTKTNPMLWQWNVDAAEDKAAQALITVHFTGGSTVDGHDFRTLDSIPPVNAKIVISPRSWIQVVTDTATEWKGMLEAVLGLLAAIAAWWKFIRKGKTDAGD